MTSRFDNLSKRIKTILPVELRMRAVKTNEIIGKKRFDRFVFYLTPVELERLEGRARSERISLNAALVEHFEEFINKLEYTRFGIEQFKRQFPELSNVYIVVEVKLTGNIRWVS